MARGRGKKKILKKGQRTAVVKRLLKELFKEDRKAWVIIFFSLIFSGIGAMAVSIFIELLIDDVIMPALGNGIESVAEPLTMIVIGMIAVYGLAVIGTIVYTQLMAKLGQTFLNRIRESMFNKMESLPVNFFDSHAHGDIMSYYTNDVDTLRQFITQSLIQFVLTLMTITFVVVTMLYYSIWLTLIVFVGSIAIFKASKDIGGKSTSYFERQQNAIGKTEGFIEEIMAGEKVVKAFNRENKAKQRFDTLNDGLYEDSKAANLYGNILMPVLFNIGNILYVIIAAAGSLFVYFSVTNVALTGIHVFSLSYIGVVVSFLTLSRQFSRRIANVSQQLPMVGMALAGAKRVFEFLDFKPETDDGDVTLINYVTDDKGNIIESEERTGFWAWKQPGENGEVTYTKLKGDIVIKHINFSYVEGEEVLHDISVFAHPGERIALVGETGAGKTTITNLLTRFYDIERGKIFYDGIDIKDIKKSSLRKSIGLVLQDVNLFTGTVKENIRYGREEATDEEVIEAAKIANAHGFIRRLPKGYDTELKAGGSNLSEGQRQLISIARAACADAPVMILDEATSSIDTRTEAIVQKGTDRLMEGRTVFVIAHRLSTIRNSHAIMVMDHGKIIERGDHDSLLKEKGIYYQLYTGKLEMS